MAKRNTIDMKVDQDLVHVLTQEEVIIIESTIQDTLDLLDRIRYFWNIPTYFNLTSLQISLKSLETITDGV